MPTVTAGRLGICRGLQIIDVAPDGQVEVAEHLAGARRVSSLSIGLEGEFASPCAVEVKVGRAVFSVRLVDKRSSTT
ncbi:hypothetical protein E3O62_02105 [Cryobacterium sp. TMT2-15-1]|uniref:hypothetical protein n=1 Tax=Cryobacterium sp. TMT2-15-1 TaxID=1259246 RepID=UPI00106DA5BA|nr:hypothetical protein [Cryobacterium sp. TMT2-15-1]TFC63647.1 hypothetical protein E3O62_02105 [Cryobacterium sp. TMT2-15-1]